MDEILIAVVAAILGGIIVFFFTMLSMIFAFQGESLLGTIKDVIFDCLPEPVQDKIDELEEKKAWKNSPDNPKNWKAHDVFGLNKE